MWGIGEALSLLASTTAQVGAGLREMIIYFCIPQRGQATTNMAE